MPPWPGSSTISGRGSLSDFGTTSLWVMAALCTGGLASEIVRRKLARSVARQIEHQPRRLPAIGRQHEGLVDLHRAFGIEHDARAALHDEAETEGLDQPAPLLAGLVGQLEGDLRHVDDNPVGIGEREGGDIEFLREVHDEAGLLVVAADAHVGRRRQVGGGRGQRLLRDSAVLGGKCPRNGESGLRKAPPALAIRLNVTNPDPYGFVLLAH